jgi:hypothetical protein
MGFDAGDSNLYRYVNNQPTDQTDANGLEVMLELGAIKRSGIVIGYHVTIVWADGKNVVVFDGGGEQSVNAQTGRPTPNRDPKAVGTTMPGKAPDGLVLKSPFKTPAEELAALDAAYGKLDQAAYRRLGPNSNTYAHQLLLNAGFPEPEWVLPAGAVAWSYSGFYSYGGEVYDKNGKLNHNKVWKDKSGVWRSPNGDSVQHLLNDKKIGPPPGMFPPEAIPPTPTPAKKIIGLRSNIVQDKKIGPPP